MVWYNNSLFNKLHFVHFIPINEWSHGRWMCLCVCGIVMCLFMSDGNQFTGRMFPNPNYTNSSHWNILNIHIVFPVLFLFSVWRRTKIGIATTLHFNCERKYTSDSNLYAFIHIFICSSLGKETWILSWAHTLGLDVITIAKIFESKHWTQAFLD